MQDSTQARRRRRTIEEQALKPIQGPKSLAFEYKPSYGHKRYYAANNATTALLTLIGRPCLTDIQLVLLDQAGIKYRII